MKHFQRKLIFKQLASCCIFILLSGSLSACSLLINLSYHSEPKVFDLYFEDFKSIYAYPREYTGKSEDCSPDELYKRYRPRVYKDMGDVALARILYLIQVECKDPHLGSYFPSDIDYAAQALLTEEQLLVLDNLVGYPSPFPDIYLDFSMEQRKENFRYGLIKNEFSPIKIGYIRVAHLIKELGGIVRLEGNRDWLSGIEDIIKHLNALEVESIIVDVRTAAGGSIDNGRYIAARFANTEGPYIKFSEKIAPDKFKDIYPAIIRPEGSHVFSEGKMILLTSFSTCSGGEMFTLAMRKRENLINIGYYYYDTRKKATAGCAGAILDKDLANGWNATFTSSQSYCLENCTPSGDANYLRQGILPDFGIDSPAWENIPAYQDINDPSYINRYDSALENALLLLGNAPLFDSVYDSISRHK